MIEQNIWLWTVAIGFMDIALLAVVVHFVIGDIRRAWRKGDQLNG